MKRNVVFFFTFFSIVFINSNYGEVNYVQVLDGNLTIAGIFEVQTMRNDGECGKVQIGSVMAIEAVRWYLQSVNNNNTLPLDIGLSVYKTCGQSGRAGDAAVDIITRYRHSKSSKESEDMVIGVLGPEYSSETKTVSSILSSQSTEERILQIGFSSTSAELNNRAKYPNYYRVMADDNVQTTALLKLMQNLKWNRIAILYVNDTYGRAGAAILEAAAEKYDICVSKMSAIEIDANRQVEAGNIREILNRYILESPTAEGVVYFGDSIIANQVMLIFDDIQINDVPIFILSESNLEADIFHSPVGVVLSKCKGTLALSLPYVKATDFSEYWKSLFTSKTMLQSASEANPYLIDVFKLYTGCDFYSNNCNALTETEASEKVLQSVYVHYVMSAATTIIQTVKKYFETCAGGCDTFDKFKRIFEPSLLIQAMDGLRVSFGGINAAFTKDSPNIQFDDKEKQYEVYNFRKETDGGDSFKFVNVGHLSGVDLYLDVDRIKDYTSDGIELGYPYLRKGQCPVSEKCEECIGREISQDLYHIPGDVYIIGLVSINNQAVPGPLGCGSTRARHGYQLLLALNFALEEFKTRSWFAHYMDMFGGKSIGLIVINSCNNALEVVPKLLDLHSKGLRLPDGAYMDLTNRILGYVGGQAADVSEPVASQLTKLKFVQISYASTNPVLSNKEMYPYFLRIVSSDEVQAMAMIAIVKELKGEYVQLVHSEGAYGEGARDAVLAAAKKEQICVVQTIEVKESDGYHEYFEMLRRRPHAKLVLVLLRSHVVYPFMRDFRQLQRGDFQFIGSEAWGMNPDVLSYDFTQGAIITGIEMDRNRDLDEYIKMQAPTQNESNSWLETYLQERQNCYFSWSYDKTFSRECSDSILPANDPNFTSDPWGIFVYNTMLAFLKGAAIFYSNQCGSSKNRILCKEFVENPDEFFQTLRNIQLDIYGTGEILIFDENGDGLMGYKIYNIQTDKADKTKRNYKLIGSYNTNMGLVMKTDDIEYPVDEPFISSCPSEAACSSCLGDDSSNNTSYQSNRDKDVIILGSCVGLLVLIAVALGLVLFFVWRKQRKKPEDEYITPTYVPEMSIRGERPATEGAHCHTQSESSYMTATPPFEQADFV